MIEVDGSLMEGGGQLLRMATTYSAILGEPVRITKIRANRNQPGLKPQHFTTLKAVAELCSAETKGLEVGSGEIEFRPGRIRGGVFDFDIGTAGSCSLLLQCAAPVAAYADEPVKITVKGGTAVRWSPPMSIVQNVVWAGLRGLGFSGVVKILRDGYYPKGGGLVEARISPIGGFKSMVCEKSVVRGIRGLSTCGGLPRHIAERQAEAALKVLREEGFEARIDVATPGKALSPYSPGSQICLWVEGDAFIGDDGLGERGKTAERVGAEAAQRLIDQIRTGAYVDLHTADNLVLPCSLSSGTSSFTVSRLTLHTLTAVEVAKSITGAKIIVEGSEGKPGRIVVEGRGFTNPRFTDHD
ncbi:MAG: RNA 3'-terminal phosphate cyclase [Candidatus Bathyarchaeota archaeon]|nr:RNA 3'-terminal phosphate cyclase [Candidatus Bathyarchaeota archaeon]